MDNPHHFLNQMASHKGEEIFKLYKDWADMFDANMAEVEYRSPGLITQTFFEFQFDPSVKILDVGAGTGAIGKLLKQKGYKNIDALDASPEMLQKAMDQDIYLNYHHCMLGSGHTIAQIPADSYDAVIACGVFVPNHMSYDVFPELLRITKPGGLLLFVRGLHYPEEFPEFGPEFDRRIEGMVEDGLWKHRIENFEVCCYLGGNNGRVYVMEKE